MENLQPQEAEHSFSQAEQLAQLEQSFTHEDAKWAAKGIRESMGSPTDHMNYPEGVRRVAEQYIDNPDASQGERDLAQLMVEAKYFANLQRSLDRETLTRNEAIQGVKGLADYSGRIKDWVEAYPQAANKSDLIDWLGRASASDNWAKQIVEGLAGEVAVKRAIEKSGREARFASSHEDVDAKMDVIVKLRNGKTAGINVKSRAGDVNEFERLHSTGNSRLDTGEKVQRYEMAVQWDEVGDDFNLSSNELNNRLSTIERTATAA